MLGCLKGSPKERPSLNSRIQGGLFETIRDDIVTKGDKLAKLFITKLNENDSNDFSTWPKVLTTLCAVVGVKFKRKELLGIDRRPELNCLYYFLGNKEFISHSVFEKFFEWFGPLSKGTLHFVS